MHAGVKSHPRVFARGLDCRCVPPHVSGAILFGSVVLFCFLASFHIFIPFGVPNAFEIALGYEEQGFLSILLLTYLPNIMMPFVGSFTARRYGPEVWLVGSTQ